MVSPSPFADYSQPDEEPDQSPESLEPSKSQRKRDADEIREFARLLTTLAPARLSQLELPTNINDAIKNCPPTSTRSAHKRHLSFISKLLRKNGNVDTFKSRLEDPVSAQPADKGHETMRDQLITAFADHAESLRQNYPSADMQQVRQLVRQINAAPSDTAETDLSEAELLIRKKAAKATKSLLVLLRANAAD